MMLYIMNNGSHLGLCESVHCYLHVNKQSTLPNTFV